VNPLRVNVVLKLALPAQILSNLKLFIMKIGFLLLVTAASHFAPICLNAQSADPNEALPKLKEKSLYIDVHHLKPGKVKSQSHAKDSAIENKYGVTLLKAWVDEKDGLVYCLSSAPDSQSIVNTHRASDGMLPTEIYQVTSGDPAAANSKNDFYLDIHELGAKNVSAKDVAQAHEKDLATEKKYGVNFLNYWVDERKGVVICLSEAKDPASIIQTHKEAHGLLPARVLKVKQNQYY
jgi:hypothetical protein